MMRLVSIVLALAAAVLAAMLADRWLGEQAVAMPRAPEVPALETVEVLVAARDVETGARLRPEDMRWQPWPAALADGRYLVRAAAPDADAAHVGAVVRSALVAGEPIQAAKLLRPGEGGVLAALLEEGRRAVTIETDLAAGVAGLIAPGDRVDVVLTHGAERDDRGAAALAARASETIVENVRVLAIDQRVSSASPAGEAVQNTGLAGRSATLEVTPEQAEAVAVGQSLGRLTLSLRSAFGGVDGVRPARFTRDVEVSAVLRGGGPAGLRVLAAARPLAPGELVTDADLEWRPAGPGLAQGKFFVEGQATPFGLRGALVVAPIGPGEPLTPAHLLRPSEAGYVPRALQPGMRAVTVGVDAVAAVAGFVAPGDRVDLLLVGALEDQGGETGKPKLSTRRYSDTIISDVRVLAVDQTIDRDSEKPEAGRTVTVEVTPKQAELLTLAASMGKLTLSLRRSLEDAKWRAADSGDPDFSRDLDVTPSLAAITGMAKPQTVKGGSGSITIYRAASPEVVVPAR
ncbi:MAG TPA: Flp pilus assembly protein CpaB [Alphaproteobacteria bacterium]|nr:Flp pilus assembly protein CpaB [Alphaproteobacteria bacterium]